jgi:hypothetical protein
MRLLRMPMKLPAAPIANPHSAGVENGDRTFAERSPQPACGIAVLDHFVEFMQFCFVCQCEQIFRAGWECEAGLLGCCLGCGDERIAPFSRAASEVA